MPGGGSEKQPDWSDRERQAWAPPQKLSPAQWADAYGVIPDNGINPEPGPVRLDRTPYLAGILDAAADPDVEEIVLLKAAQVGFSTLTRLLLGYWIDVAPGPALIVLPDELSAKEWLDEDVVPTLEQTPRLQRYRLAQKKNNKDTAIRVTSMRIFGAWATSPQRLARRPIRYLIADEVDKFPAFSGKEADPIALAQKRLSNFGRRAKSLIGSTPTTRLGAIWRRWESCGDRRHFWVPCPDCRRHQRLTWPRISYPLAESGEDRKSHANRILTGDLAVYRCQFCDGLIREAQKPTILRGGIWASESQTVEDRGGGGVLTGARPRARRVGFALSALYSPWVSFSRLASEWLLAQEDPLLLMDFVNSRRAEPFEQQTRNVSVSKIREKATGAPPPLIVPGWARALIASADTQGADEKTGWFPYVVRAWGPGLRSQLIRYGIAATFGELKANTLDATFAVDDGRRTCPSVLLIDSGGPRWSEVYQFAQAERGRVIPTKGSDHPLPSVVSQRHQRRHGIVLWLIDTERSKDLLARLIDDGDRGRWLPHGQVGDDYCQQLSAEHKIFDRASKRERWVEKSSGAANHFWDCEHQQCAAAWEMGLGMEDETQPPPEQPAEASPGWQIKPW